MKKLFVCLICMLCMSGCTENGGNTVPTSKPSDTGSVSQTVKASEADFSKCKTVVSEYSFDFNKDGGSDLVRLCTSAEELNGQIMWDDSQDWLLAVTIGKNDYVLYDGKVPAGDVSYSIFERADDTAVISVTEKSTASYTVTEYMYTENGFEKIEAVKEEGINFIVSSQALQK